MLWREDELKSLEVRQDACVNEKEMIQSNRNYTQKRVQPGWSGWR